MKSFLKKLKTSLTPQEQTKASGSLRKGRRVPLTVKVEIQSEESTCQAVTLNISTKGVAFVSSAHLVVGKEVQLTLALPANEGVNHLEVKATVKETRPTNEKWTIGAEFTDLEEGAKRLLQETIRTEMNKTGDKKVQE